MRTKPVNKSSIFCVPDQYCGFGHCVDYLRNIERKGWNHKRVYRIHCALELNLRIKTSHRLMRQVPEPLKEPIKLDQVWSMVFMHDQLSESRHFLTLNMIDDC